MSDLSSSPSSSSTSSSLPTSHKKPPAVQRVLIMQGGGALGAYEVGVFKALYEKISEHDRRNGQATRPLFDIVAGTSIGAVNACIIVDYVKRNKNWDDGIVKTLYKFWDEISYPIWWPSANNEFVKGLWRNAADVRDLQSAFFKKGILPLMSEAIQKRQSSSSAQFNENHQQQQSPEPLLTTTQKQNNSNNNNTTTQDSYSSLSWREQWPFLSMYFLWPDNFGPLASEEAVRRYWSWYQFAYTFLGTPNVLWPAIVQPDMKFLNPFNIMIRYSNWPLVETIRRYWDYERHPIKTSPEEGEPRLLLVTIDLQDSTTATFDSYSKGDGQWKTEYGDDKAWHEIKYPVGITMDHLLTCMSSHLRYKNPTVEVATYSSVSEDMIMSKEKKEEAKAEERSFLDGFYLSNTPLREVLQAHRDYWHKVAKAPTVPDLEVYIVDVYPTVEKGVPMDPDGIQNRVGDILYHDKTKYDEKMACMVSDYVDLANKLLELARQGQVPQDKIDAVLNGTAPISKKRDGSDRKYKDLLEGRFKIAKMVRIELIDSGKDDINGKAFEFSTKSIEELRDRGYQDAIKLEL